MSIANTDQAERWNSGEDLAHWLTNQARYDRMNEPFAALILAAARLRPGRHVLDVGCGCGGTTLAAARVIAPSPRCGPRWPRTQTPMACAWARGCGSSRPWPDRQDAGSLADRE
jgi:Mycolic acid cyclopropane synthetase